MNRLQVVTKGAAEWSGVGRQYFSPNARITLGRQNTLGCQVVTLTFSPTDPMGPTPPGGPCGPCRRKDRKR